MTAQTSTRVLAPPRFYPWRELALFCVILSEVSWTAWLCSLLPYAGGNIPYPRVFSALFGVAILAMGAARLLNYLQLKVHIRQRIILGLLGLVVLVGLPLIEGSRSLLAFFYVFRDFFRILGDEASLSLPPGFFVLMVILLLWRRGISLASVEIDRYVAWESFRWGIVAFLVAGVILRPALSSETIGALGAFVAFGMLGIGAARIYGLGFLRGGRDTPFTGRWLAILLVSVAAALAFTFSAAQVFGKWLFGPVLWLLRAGATVFAMLGSLVILPLVALLADLLGRIHIETKAEVLKDQPQQMADLLDELSKQAGDTVGLPFPLIKYALVTLAVGLVVLLIVLSVRHYAWQMRQMGQDETEEAPGGLGKRRKRTLGSRLSDLMNRLRRRDAMFYAAEHIRRIYWDLMQLSRRLGSPRPPALTPAEFLGTLNKVFPDTGAELAVITDAYQKVRYGQLPETVEEVTQVDQAWERVTAVGQEQLLAQKAALKAAKEAKK